MVLSRLTECLDVVLVPAALDVLDHQAGLADLGIADHADLDDHAGVLCRVLLRGGALRVLLVGARITFGARVAAQLRTRSRVRLGRLRILGGVVEAMARRCVCVRGRVEARVVGVAPVCAVVLVGSVGVGGLGTGFAGVAVAVAAGALLELGQRQGGSGCRRGNVGWDFDWDFGCRFGCRFGRGRGRSLGGGSDGGVVSVVGLKDGLVWMFVGHVQGVVGDGGVLLLRLHAVGPSVLWLRLGARTKCRWANGTVRKAAYGESRR